MRILSIDTILTGVFFIMSTSILTARPSTLALKCPDIKIEDQPIELALKQLLKKMYEQYPIAPKIGTDFSELEKSPHRHHKLSVHFTSNITVFDAIGILCSEVAMFAKVGNDQIKVCLLVDDVKKRQFVRSSAFDQAIGIPSDVVNGAYFERLYKLYDDGRLSKLGLFAPVSYDVKTNVLEIEGTTRGFQLIENEIIKFLYAGTK